MNSNRKIKFNFVINRQFFVYFLVSTEIEARLQQEIFTNNHAENITQALYDLTEILKQNLTYQDQIDGLIAGEISQFFLDNNALKLTNR